MTDQDTQSIVNVINLYGFAVDTQCWSLFDRIFTPDVDADFSASAHWHELSFSEEEIAMTGSDKIKADALVLQATRKLASAME